MEVLQHTPRFTAAEAEDLARRLYGIDAAASPLPSERDQNFRIGDFVLKIANAEDDRPLLEAQNDALVYVARRTSLAPRIVAAPDGVGMRDVVGANGSRHIVRLLTWLPGAPLASVAPPPFALLEQVGSAVAELDWALEGFDHPAVHREFYWDLANAAGVVRRFAPLVEDAAMRKLVTRVVETTEARDGALLARLRQAVVHNDPNDHNVLVDLPPNGGSHSGEVVASGFSRKVTGILDFGDIVHSYAIADLAIATAYAVLGQRDPFEAILALARGYGAVRPLDADEIAALLPLVLLRLCASACIAAHQRRQRPVDEYLGVSQGPIRATLPALAELDRAALVAALREICGYAPENDASAAAETRRARECVIGNNVSIAYRTPVKTVRGWMQFLFDESGRRYLDAYNNVPHVGHCHPRVVEAASSQLRRLNTNTRYLDDHLVQFAERLGATFPEPLRICYFVSSGSEANELALRLARAHTKSRGTIVLDAAYHGNTTTLIDISPYKHNGPGGDGPPAWVRAVPIPDMYRGLFKASDPSAGMKYAQFVTDAAAQLATSEHGVAAFIAESAPSVGGQILLPPGYLSAAYAAVRASGGVCIADEVQTAYGRMGTHFYAFEGHQVVPDIVVLGKPIGNGYPLGAVVTTPAIAASFDNGMEFFSTFGGSTVSCAVGLTVLDVVRQEGLQEHALDVGRSLLEALRSLLEHPLVGDVRGSGLFIGIELVKDRESLAPATDEACAVVNRMRDQAILLGTDGPYANVLKIRPPMPFTRDDAERLASTLTRVLGEVRP
jgi:4-aminobutyrate aminotransferase-like enzyme/Ser/Thr protein kinase RdoA (MazF antagonist)